MTATRMVLRMMLVAIVAAASAAQDYGPRHGPGQPRGDSEVPPAGFWPTEKMIYLAIDRITDQMAKEYGFDEAQLLNTRELLKDRFPRWLQDNRAQLQALTNQYIEAVMGGEPPSKEEAATWARSAQPLFGEFSTLIEDTVEDMGTYLTDEQRILMEGQMAAFQVGSNYMNQRLDVWSRGGYDPDRDWPRNPRFKEIERERRERLEREAEEARNAAMGLPPGPAPPTPGEAPIPGGGPTGPAAPTAKATPSEKAAPKDGWAQYVEDFIRRFQLDEGQQNKAHRYLRDQTGLRDRYLRSKVARINAVETKLKAAKTDEEKSKVTAELDQLNGPIERMFENLKDRLDRLPTRKQRAAAEPTSPSSAGDSGSSLRDQMQARAKAGKSPPGGGSPQHAGDEQPVKPRGG